MIKKHIGFLFASERSEIISKWRDGIFEKMDYEKYKQCQNRGLKKIFRKFKIFYYKFKMFLYSVLLCKEKVQRYKNKINTVDDIPENWDYMGNSILNPILSKYIKNKIKEEIFDLMTVFKHENFLPEIKYANGEENRDKYVNFYFKNDVKDDIIRNAINDTNIIYLHNSWTPIEYKLMSKEEFLKQDITLSKILKCTLDIL
jgi:hypothetical protein